MRIETAAGSSNEAVAVLVHASWGGRKFDISLAGGRTYQLSAWVKLKDQDNLPSLRLSLPANAAGATRSGADPIGADGWQRIWSRVETLYPVSPSYVGVWVQGPGTVWVTGLSLTEVIAPPVRVSLDQDRFDDQDHLAVARVTVAPGVTPDAVAFTLAPVGGAPLDSVTAPFQSEASIRTLNHLMLLAPATLRSSSLAFDPSSLIPGRYELKVRLVGVPGGRVDIASVEFERAGTSASR